MTATVDRKAFASALAAVKGAIEGKPTIPVLAMVKLSGEGGILELRATNLSIMAAATVPYTGYDFTLCAPRYMLEGLAGATSEKIVFSAADHSVSGTCGVYAIRGSILPSDVFPEITADEPGETAWTMSAKQLRWLIAATMGACEPPGTDRFFLTGVHLTTENSSLIAVATDGHIMAVARRDIRQSGPFPENIIVPHATCSEIVRFCDRADGGDVEIALSEAAIELTSGAMRLWSKLIDGAFVDWRRVLVEPGAHGLTLDVDSFAGAIGRVAIAPKTESSKEHLDPSGTIGIQADGGACTIAIKTRESEISDEVAIDDSTRFPLRFFKRRQIKAILDGFRAGDFEQIALSVGDNANAPVRFEHPLSKDYFGVLIATRPPVAWRLPEHEAP